MLANNLDVMNLAIFEREEALRRQSHAYIIAEQATGSSLRTLVSRIFGALGGEPVKTEPVVTIAGGSVDRPVSLTLVHLPATIMDEARERAA